MLDEPAAQRIRAVLDHLSLDRVHVGACMSADWGGLTESATDRIATLTIVAPHLNKGVPAGASTFVPPTLVIAGGDGRSAGRARSLAAAFPNGEFVALPGYESPIWADTVADRLEEVKSALVDFLTRADAKRGGPLATVTPTTAAGECEGLRYRIRGKGPPLLLLP